MNIAFISLIIGLIFLVAHLIFYYLSKYGVININEIVYVVIFYSLLGISFLAYGLSVFSFYGYEKNIQALFLIYTIIFIFFGIYVGMYIAIPKVTGTGFNSHEIWPLSIIVLSLLLSLFLYQMRDLKK